MKIPRNAFKFKFFITFDNVCSDFMELPIHLDFFKTQINYFYGVILEFTGTHVICRLHVYIYSQITYEYNLTLSG